MNTERIPSTDAAIAALEMEVNDPSQFPTPHASTGTVDDEDAPGDEHDGENEASARETSDETEAPEEFEREGEASSRARQLSQNSL